MAQTFSSDGSDELAGRILPGLVSGETTAAWCVTEPGSPGMDEIGLAARPEDGAFVLDGVKSPVEAGADADWLMVTARTAGGVTQFIIPSSTPGVEIAAQRSGLVGRHASVRFTNVRVPAAAVVGRVDGAEEAVERQLRTALVLQCAESPGAVERVFEFTVQSTFDRYSFGRPLASYQALKHRFADMKVVVESTQAITVEATKAVQVGAADAAEVVRIAKAYVGEHSPS